MATGIKAAGWPGFTLTWRASKGLPRTNIAQSIRAFLLASATAAFCHPDFSRNWCAHFEIGLITFVRRHYGRLGALDHGARQATCRLIQAANC